MRLIGLDNQQIGVVRTAEALNMAQDAGVDLVEVAPNSEPPVCRLMDYGKWKYNQKKKDHKAKVKQHQVVLKEVRLRPKIDTHDINFKLKRAREFLEKGSKVQFTMLFRGREMMHLDRALEMFKEIEEKFENVGKVEMPAKRQGRRMMMIMAPQPPTATKPAAATKAAAVTKVVAENKVAKEGEPPTG